MPKLIEIGNVTELERIIKTHTNLAELNPEIGLKSIIEFYEKSDSLTVDSNENPIPLYVTYGVDNWKMDQKTFEITFANQRINQNDGKLYEYRIDLIYEPNDFMDEEEFMTKNSTEIQKFKNEVMNSSGFKKAMKNQPNRIIIIEEQI
ncbi:hypothetical protein SAMN05428642_11210 [Flaviramulus basaltis]|uniref:Uncharacterized protein n=1 Tax=Flaviramulus basaltis TaxID=369401 RepID=A0A1K2ISN4_9FLAO|nr:hypothetical protein [Flaviramulus basaltis]SFZ95200.1 hypothetical protein SAMN05428642_11210 [Flaviramulus basaltis]